MVILGIDPGSVIVGYGIIKTQKEQNKKFKVLDFGCIVAEQILSPGERLKKIHKEVLKLISTYKPNIVAVESLFFFKNLKTVMPVSQAKGVILLAIAQKKIPVCEFTPLQVKMTVVGYGRAEKKQVQKMTKEILDLSKFDFKKNNRKKDDASDALSVAICAAFKYPHGL